MPSKLNPSVKESLFVYGSGVLITISSFIFFSITGYPLVRTATQTLNMIAPPLYMVPIFLPFGMMLGEIVWVWEVSQELGERFLLLVQCILIGFFSFLRFVINIPLSGHAIIIFFFLMHQGITNRLKHLVRVLIGTIVLIIIIVFKLFLWNDPLTFVLGALLGVGIWVLGFFIKTKHKSVKSIDF